MLQANNLTGAAECAVREEISALQVALIESRLAAKDFPAAENYLSWLREDQSASRTIRRRFSMALGKVCVAHLIAAHYDDAHRIASELCNLWPEGEPDQDFACGNLIRILIICARCKQLKTYRMVEDHVERITQEITTSSVQNRILIYLAAERVRSVVLHNRIDSVAAAQARLLDTRWVSSNDITTRRWLAAHILRVTCWQLGHACLEGLDELYRNAVVLASRELNNVRNELSCVMLRDWSERNKSEIEINPYENSFVIGDSAFFMTKNFPEPMSFVSEEINARDICEFMGVLFLASIGGPKNLHLHGDRLMNSKILSRPKAQEAFIRHLKEVPEGSIDPSMYDRYLKLIGHATV